MPSVKPLEMIDIAKITTPKHEKFCVGAINSLPIQKKKALLKKLQKRDYRNEYVRSTVINGLAHQFRLNREHRGLTQEKLAVKCGEKTTQVSISRIEDPAYGKLSLSTIFKIASAMDLALIVKLVPYSKFLIEYANKSPSNLIAKSFCEENLETNQAIVQILEIGSTLPNIIKTYYLQNDSNSTIKNLTTLEVGDLSNQYLVKQKAHHE